MPHSYFNTIQISNDSIFSFLKKSILYRITLGRDLITNPAGRFFLDYIQTPRANPKTGRISWNNFFKRVQWPDTVPIPVNVLKIRITADVTAYFVETFPFILDNEEVGTWLQWAVLPVLDGEDVKALATRTADYDLAQVVPRGIANVLDFPLVAEFLNRTSFSEFVFNGQPLENLERQKAMMDHCFEHLKARITTLVDTCNKRESQRTRNFDTRPRQPNNPQMAIALPGPAMAVAPLQTSESPVSFQTIPAPTRRSKKNKRKDSSSSSGSDSDDASSSSSGSDPVPSKKGKGHKKKKSSKSKGNRK